METAASYGIATDSALEVPTSLAAVILSDCRRCTRSSVVLPLDKANGIVIRKLPPNPCAVVLWNHDEEDALTSIVRLVVVNVWPCLGAICIAN